MYNSKDSKIRLLQAKLRNFKTPNQKKEEIRLKLKDLTLEVLKERADNGWKWLSTNMDDPNYEDRLLLYEAIVDEINARTNT